MKGKLFAITGRAGGSVCKSGTIEKRDAKRPAFRIAQRRGKLAGRAGNLQRRGGAFCECGRNQSWSGKRAAEPLEEFRNDAAGTGEIDPFEARSTVAEDDPFVEHQPVDKVKRKPFRINDDF